MARDIESYEVEPGIVGLDADQNLGVPAALAASSVASAKRATDAISRIADALERIATTNEARETRESAV